MASSLPSSSSRGASGSTSSTLPSDASEISATAQALLQAHYGHLKQGDSAASTSSIDAAAALQSQLAKLEQAISNLDRICVQLDNLQVAQQLHAGTATSSSLSSKTQAAAASRILQPLGPLAFHPARLRLDAAAEHVFMRRDVEGLTSVRDQLLLEDEVLPVLVPRPESGGKVSVSVKLPEPSRTVQVEYVKVGIKDAQMQLQARKASYLTYAAEVRERLSPQQSARGDSANKQSSAATGTNDHMVNDQNEALNEEGLPFYEPVERISEEEATTSKKAYMQPFVRADDKQGVDKEERRRWLDDMLSKLEEEELNEGSDGDPEGGAPSGSASTADGATSAAAEETRVVLRTRTPSPPPSPDDSTKPKQLPEIVSAARPPPPKSALKPSAARPDIVQRPSFGSAGIRHGFLNLNPSSPGAIKSSYSWEDLEREENKPDASQRPSRSQTPTPLSRSNSTAASSLLARVTDAGSSPVTSGTSTPTKKSVRIKSPERAHPEASAGSGLTPLQRALRSSIRVKENYTQPATASQPVDDGSSAMARSLESGSGTAEKRHRDDIGVEQEAERIVKLLGPDVVEGHPNAPPPDVLRKMQEAHEQDKRMSTPEAVAARVKQEEEQRERERLQRLAEKPALGHNVMERPKSTPSAAQSQGKDLSTQVKAQAQQAKFSAFKQGFLNQKPATSTKFVPNKAVPRKAAGSVPAAPTQSMGMSALDRASLGDDELSQRRQAMGLPAAVPHARPSKAYAEKMKQRQQGQESESSGQEDKVTQEVKLARPVTGDDVPRPGRVRFGPAAGSADDDEDEDGHEHVTEINPSATLDNHMSEDVDHDQELDEEQEEPKIEGEGADTDEEDAYFDSYLSKRSRRAAAAADSRGLNVDQDDDDGFDGEDADDWDVDEDDFDQDDDDDDDFDYDPEDLMALAPSMGADSTSLSAHPELLREYEEARAKLAAMGLAMPRGGAEAGGASDETRKAMMAAAHAGGGEEEDDYEMDIVPLDAAVEDAEYQGNTTSSGPGAGSRISRFKASLAKQKTSANRTAPSNNLEDVLSTAQNLGQSHSSNQTQSAAFDMDGRPPHLNNAAPMMIIPQLAPVRFPKNGDLVEGKPGGPVDLDGGDSDEDDERAEMVMRSRLERAEWKRNHPEEARRLAESKRAREMVESGQAPPPVLVRRQQDEVKLEEMGEGKPEKEEKEEEETKPKKKVSRFKAARMAQ